MHCIENDYIKIAVAEKGAELQSLVYKHTGIEYMWNGNPAVWGKHSPVLFPIVGSLKNNSYYFKDKAYQLPRHGFARDMLFTLHNGSSHSLSFLLQSDEHTRQQYPFDFEFFIHYTINKSACSVTYEVKNTSAENMYFSVGGHPAFKIPLFEGDGYEDYALEFDEIENADRWPIEAGGLISNQFVPFLRNTNILPLHKQLFYTDALVFKNICSNRIRLISQKNKQGIAVNFHNFPYLGVWAAKDADFVCIEPWCGIADSVDANQLLENKEGIQVLQPEDTLIRTWSVEIIN